MLDQLLSTGRDYDRFGLSGNPFPYTSIPSVEPKLFVDTAGLLPRLKDMLVTTYSTSQSTFGVLIGPYGSGKSHTLRYVHAIARQLASVNPLKRTLSCYLSSPGQDFLHIYRNLIEQIGMDRIAQAASAADLEQIPYNLSVILRQLRSDELASQAWRWLLGEKLRASERAHLGVSTNLDEPLCLAAMSHVMRLLAVSGYTLVCLLVDELEAINELYPLRKQALFNAMRRMIDENPQGLCVMFACTPAGWDEVLQNSIGLARRLSRNIIYLSRLTRDYAKQVIEVYLEGSRSRRKHIESARGKGPSVLLHPFTEAGLDELFRISQGNLGELLKYCNIVIDRALDTNLTSISAESVKELVAGVEE